ncbi:putative DNA mismatch repair protein MutS, core [Plasmopara halstedii]
MSGPHTQGQVELNDEELVFMSILYDRGELGVAIFDALSASLKNLQPQIADMEELEEIIERLHTQFRVNHVLVSSRNASTNGMLRIVKKLDDTHQTKTGISIRKHSDFNYLKACQTIEHVQIGAASDDFNKPHIRSMRREASTFLGSFFDFESTQLIRATGALLIYLLTEKIGNQLDDVESLYLSTVEHIALDGFMFIDKSTFQSLQIFNHEAHPSLIKGAGRAKEGFSLFGLLNRTVTKSGAFMLHRWMLTPLVTRGRIEERQSSVAFFTDVENDEIRQLLLGKLKRFRDVAGIFQRIKRRCASVGDWCRFATSIGSFLEARSLIGSLRGDTASSLPSVFSKVSGEQGASHINNLLVNVIDFEESQQETTVVIRSGVSEALDAARERYEDLDNVLTEVAFQVKEANPILSSITVQYIPQVGYVICCDSPTTLPEFVFQFQEDDTTFYYKDACCRDLDESIGDIFGLILDMQKGKYFLEWCNL